MAQFWKKNLSQSEAGAVASSDENDTRCAGVLQCAIFARGSNPASQMTRRIASAGPLEPKWLALCAKNCPPRGVSADAWCVAAQKQATVQATILKCNLLFGLAQDQLVCKNGTLSRRWGRWARTPLPIQNEVRLGSDRFSRNANSRKEVPGAARHAHQTQPGPPLAESVVNVGRAAFGDSPTSEAWWLEKRKDDVANIANMTKLINVLHYSLPRSPSGSSTARQYYC